MTETNERRDFLVEWCAMLSGYGREAFENKTDSELEREYVRLMVGESRVMKEGGRA